MPEPRPNSIFQHYKGQKYKYLGVVRHSETLEELVLYEALYENALGKIWVRPKEMFFGTVEKNGKTIRRFQPIEDEAKPDELRE